MLSNFTRETCTGTGDAITLTGAVEGHIPFSASYANGDQVAYTIIDADGVKKVEGIGTYNAGVITRNDTWSYDGTTVDKAPTENIALSASEHQVINTVAASLSLSLTIGVFQLEQGVIPARPAGYKAVNYYTWNDPEIDTSLYPYDKWLEIANPLPLPQVVATLALPTIEVGSTGTFNASGVFSGQIDSYAIASGTLPAWLTFNTETCVFTYTNAQEPSVTGISLTATNARGVSAATNIADWTVTFDIYEPVDRLAMFNYVLDVNGWTPKVPEADSQFVYLSETGDDGTAVVYNYADSTFPDYFNPTGEMAFATLAAARAACYREGKSDFLCVKRGDNFVLTVAWSLSINGSANRHHLTSYGDLATPRPTIDCQMYGNGNDSFIKELRANFAITDIEFTNSQRNPSSPNFVGWMDLQDNKFLFTFGGTGGPQGFLLEGCKVSWFEMGIYFANGQGVGNSIIRRNVFHNLYGPGFSIGLNPDEISLLEEENLFYKCGYYDIYADTKQTTSGYTGTVEKTLATALTGAAETSVTLSGDIPSNTPIGTPLIIKTDSTAEIKVPILSFTGPTAEIPATDFSADPAAIGNLVNIRVYGAVQFHHSFYGVALDDCISRRSISIKPPSIHYKYISDSIQSTITSENVSLYDCLLIDGEICVSAGGNIQPNTSPRFANFDVSGNLAVHIGQSNNRGLSWGTDLSDQQNSRSINNIYALPTPLATSKRAGSLGNNISNVLVANNISYLQGNFGDTGVFINQNYDLYGLLTESTPGVTFVNTNVGLDAFMSTGTIEEGIEAFANALLNRRRGDWSDLDTQYKDFVRSRMTPTNLAPIFISQPQSRTVYNSGDVIELEADAYSQTPATYQWQYANGDPVVGGVSRKLSIAVTGDVGFRVAVTNAAGTTVSSLASIVLASRNFSLLADDTDSLVTQVPELGGTATSGALRLRGQGMRVKARFNLAEMAAGSDLAFGETILFGNGNLRYSWSESLGYHFVIRYGGPFYYASVDVNLNDGADHIIEVLQPFSGDMLGVTIDGVFYPVNSGYIPGAVINVDTSTFRGSSLAGDVVMFDIEYFTRDSVTLEDTQLAFYAVDDALFNGATASADVGTGIITYNVASA